MTGPRPKNTHMTQSPLNPSRTSGPAPELKRLRLTPRKLIVPPDRASRLEGECRREPGVFLGADDHIAR